LGEKIEIGPMSKYVTFAKCLFELVGEARSEHTVIDRLTTAKDEIAALVRQ
jgi:hypothetical protein